MHLHIHELPQHSKGNSYRDCDTIAASATLIDIIASDYYQYIYLCYILLKGDVLLWVAKK